MEKLIAKILQASLFPDIPCQTASTRQKEIPCKHHLKFFNDARNNLIMSNNNELFMVVAGIPQGSILVPITSR